MRRPCAGRWFGCRAVRSLFARSLGVAASDLSAELQWVHPEILRRGRARLDSVAMALLESERPVRPSGSESLLVRRRFAAMARLGAVLRHV